MRAVLLMAATVLASGAVAAPSKQSTSANERAYTLTLMCAVVASTGKNDADKQRAMDAARKMAKASGQTADRLSKDLIAMANVLGNEARNDASAMDRRRQNCRKIGLVS
jgi:hypothetical protein